MRVNEPKSAEDRSRRSAVIDWMDRHLGDDFKLAPYQRQFVQQMSLYTKGLEKKEVKVALYTTPYSYGLFPEYVLVRPGQRQPRPPVDYYRSASWKANEMRLFRHITTWGTD